MEYDAIESDPKNVKKDMNDLAAAGWEIITVTNGHKGSEHYPPAVTLWVRRPRPSELEKAAAKPASQRLAEARGKKRD